MAQTRLYNSLDSMPLASATHIGPYEISSLIGAGGMGEVYKARDTRLNRDVAIKVLPASFAADRERLRRFQQEAQSVAALSHPNIVATYDTGLHNGAPYLVSELLEGESLRDLLARGPLSHRKAINYAIQVARGLAAAHSKGIAHRDLKPDNVFVTRDGQVKILDFGLAKSIAGPVSSHDATVGVTGTVTDAGTVMGTAGYMSPEQVRGAAVDARTDIFSFGAVLYEMLTGARAFKRDTAVETMSAILNEDPPEIVATGRQIPPALARTIHHCLEKSPDQRFQTARDLAFDLESASNLTPSSGQPVAKGRPQYQWWRYVLAALAIALILAFSTWRILSFSRPVTGSQFHQLTFRRGDITDARFSPDGQTAIYTAAWEGSKPEIYTVPVDRTIGHPLGITDARLLSISSQGEMAIALSPKSIPYSFLAPGTLARASSSGSPRPEIENVESADYTPDGSALAIVRFVPEKYICQLEYPIDKVLYSAQALTNLRFSPSGHYLAFIAHFDQSDDRGQAIIISTTGEKVASSAIYSSAQGLAWTPSGNEIWFTSPLISGQIHALSTSGKSRDVLSVPGRLFLRDIAPNGRLLVEQGIVRHGIIVSSNGAERDLSWMDFGELRAISNDGKMILFEEEGEESKDYTIYARNTDGSPATPIGDGYGLALSPDKSWALGQKLAEPANQVWLLPVGPGEPHRISPPSLAPTEIVGGFTPDGKSIVYIAQESGHAPRTWLQNLSGGDPRPITPDNTGGWLVSPNGKWLLAGSRQQGRFTELVPINSGAAVPIKSLKPDDFALGWTSDNRLYVRSSSPDENSIHVEKLDPLTGTRSASRDFHVPAIGGLETETFLLTPDGNTYAYHYHLSLSDLYTISAPR